MKVELLEVVSLEVMVIVNLYTEQILMNLTHGQYFRLRIQNKAYE